MGRRRPPNREAKMDRTEAARCLAKAVAYVSCGKLDEAAHWLRQLVRMFEDAGVAL